jgi:hypothetical protein
LASEAEPFSQVRRQADRVRIRPKVHSRRFLAVKGVAPRRVQHPLLLVCDELFAGIPISLDEKSVKLRPSVGSDKLDKRSIDNRASESIIDNY